MILQTITQVARRYDISTRTLRYYEQIGLLPSAAAPGYTCRCYDEAALKRLQQIIVLRRLRIPLKEIGRILEDGGVVSALTSFQAKIGELDAEIAALSTIRAALEELVVRLRSRFACSIASGLLEDRSLMELIDSLSVTKNDFREGKSMDDLDRANDSLGRLKDVRIVYLPPAAVAASRYVGKDPEEHAGMALDAFVRESGLCSLKPDLRHYGFNHPNPRDGNDEYGYEMWVTIPEDMEVPAPLVKKHFKGGLYAAHMIAMGNFHEWQWLFEWVNGNDKYATAALDDGGECMYGLLEEHLNYISHLASGQSEPGDMQLDLLFPVKLKPAL